MRSLCLLFIALVCGVLSHPAPTFLMTIVDVNGVEMVNPTYQVDQLSTIYFRFNDFMNHLANGTFPQISN